MYNVYMIRISLNVEPQDFAYMKDVVKGNMSDFIRKAIKTALTKYISTGAYSPSKRVEVKHG